MLVSVMIPTFNRQGLIGRTLRSVLGQTHQDLEIVVVDDCSQDDSVREVESIQKETGRVRLVVNEKNLGLTRNWNKCISLATGDVVQIMQSDDLIDPDYLERVVAVFKDHSEVGFVAASCRYIDGDDQEISPGVARPPKLARAGDEALCAILLGGHPHVSSVVVRKACFERVGVFDEAIWHGPEVEMDARLAANFGFYHIGAVCTSFRRHGTNIGLLEYLKQGFIDVDMRKRRLAWGYLSESTRRQLGVKDLDQYVAREGAKSALLGSVVATIYRRRGMARDYLKMALRLDRTCVASRRFAKATLACLLPGPVGSLLRRRMHVTPQAEVEVERVKQSLDQIQG